MKILIRELLSSIVCYGKYCCNEGGSDVTHTNGKLNV